MKYRFLCISVVAIFVIAPVTYGADNFVLSRFSVINADGTILETLQPEISATGTMTVDGNQVRQAISLTIGGQTATVSATAEILNIENNIATLLNSNGFISQLVLINCCNPVLTFVNFGGNAEVDQWVLTSSSIAQSFDPSSERSNTLELQGHAGSTVISALAELQQYVE